MRSRATRLVISLVLSLVVLFSACGDADDTSATTQPTTTEPTTTTSTTTEPTTTTSTTTEPTTEPTTEAPDTRTVLVFFSAGDGSDCAEVAPVERAVDASLDPIRAAFDELVGGPTDAEEATGVGSFFSAETAGMVRSTELITGRLTVDFEDRRSAMNNASTSCGSEALLAQLNRTAFQFPDVATVRYQFDGSCDEFMNWLQRDCADFDPAGNQLAVPLAERASGSGCAPGPGTLPDGRWFGYVESATATELEFDLACWFTGTAAAEAAAEDGEESPPPNDYHIRNDSDVVRTLAVGAGAEATWLPNEGDPSSAETVAYGVWVTARRERPTQLGAWLVIADGSVQSIEEQYQP